MRSRELTDEQKAVIAELKKMAGAIKIAPWYPRGLPDKKGGKTYRLDEDTEKFICQMRNNVDWILSALVPDDAPKKIYVLKSRNKRSNGPEYIFDPK